MTTPKAKTNNLLYAKLINKKRNQSAVDIEKDLNLMEKQQQQEQNNKNQVLQQELGDSVSSHNSNNYSFDQNKNNNYFNKTNEQFYGNMDKKAQDNLDYINGLMQSLKQQEIRTNQKKAAVHARTKSSLGQYSSTQSQQAYPNQPIQNDLNTLANAQRAERESHNHKNSFDSQLKDNTQRIQNENNQDSKENSQPQGFQHQIQHKSLSHRSLNETLPIFSKQKSIHQNDNPLQKSTHSVGQVDIQKASSQGQHNNLSFKIDSERKSMQHQYQQQQLNKINNSESLSGNETNHSTGISVQKTDQAQFLQFLGNYVTYLSQPDESPSQISSKPNSNLFQNNFFNSHNSSICNNNNNRYLQTSQFQNIQMQNEQLLKENIILKQSYEKVHGEKKELQYQKNLQQLEIQKLMNEKIEEKNKIAQLEKIIKQQQIKYNEACYKLKHTQDNLAKITIDRENDHYTLKYALQQLQSQQQKNSEMSSFKQNSKNSYSSQNFNFTSKGKESMNDLKFEDFENNSHFFSVHNPKYPMQPKISPHLKSPMNFQKVPISMNRSNFQQPENIYEGEAILNNTGIFNYPNQHIMGGEDDEVEKHNMSIKPQVMNQNLMNFGQISDHEQEVEYDAEGNLYNNQFEGEQYNQQYDLQHPQNLDKSQYMNYNNNIEQIQLHQQQQRNKKYHSLHMRNQSSDEKNISESFYQNFLQNKMINELNNKAKFQQHDQMQNMSKIQKQDIIYKSKGNILKNSSINNSQSSKINFNSSNLGIPSGDYFQDISQTELQNNSLSLHQLE